MKKKPVEEFGEEDYGDKDFSEEGIDNFLNVSGYYKKRCGGCSIWYMGNCCPNCDALSGEF